MAMEAWGQTEQMRHIPRLELLIEKLDRELRARIETLSASLFESSSMEPALQVRVEAHFRQVCRWLERAGDQSRGKRSHASHEFNVRARARSALAYAVESLSALDPAQFRQRNPDHYFERSRGECVYASFLAAVWHLEELIVLAARVDPDLYMKLIEPPYLLQPLQEELAGV